uniref:Uncharacterized protein n=1 Tax=Caenorhabditis japonica TaxID=281687 RepID=A0A8R1I9V6_CAEJA
MNINETKTTSSQSSTPSSGGVSKKPPGLVLPTISVNAANTFEDALCPMIYEQGPSHPSSPTLSSNAEAITTDLMNRIKLFSSQFDTARLSPNYATSDLGSSARSSFSTASWMAYREQSMEFEESKELISPFDCDTACSVSPSFSLSPNSFNHFSFDARSVSSLGHHTNNLKHLLAVGAYELSR